MEDQKVINSIVLNFFDGSTITYDRGIVCGFDTTDEGAEDGVHYINVTTIETFALAQMLEDGVVEEAGENFRDFMKDVLRRDLNESNKH